MTSQSVPESEAEIRWRKWLGRGAKRERRTTKRMTALMLVIALGLSLSLSAALMML